MNKLIIAAAMVFGFAAAANETHGKKETKTTTTTTAPAVPTAPAASTPAASATMTKEVAEKECKTEKATDMKACVAGKMHKAM
ncbi:MAG: hypothetical protein AB7N80_13750 [Bdellovibrionales bacterium]